MAIDTESPKAGNQDSLGERARNVRRASADITTLAGILAINGRHPFLSDEQAERLGMWATATADDRQKISERLSRVDELMMDSSPGIEPSLLAGDPEFVDTIEAVADHGIKALSPAGEGES